MQGRSTPGFLVLCAQFSPHSPAARFWSGSLACAPGAVPDRQDTTMPMPRVIAALLLACLARPAYAACAGYDIVIVAGQSNAVGRGLEGTWSYPRPSTASRVFQVVRTYAAGEPDTADTLTPAQFSVAQATEPLDNDTLITDVQNPSRIGFAYAFSQYVAASLAARQTCVVIVPAARSGTSVLAWNLVTRQYAGDLSFFYLDMINRAKLALAKFPGSHVTAFLWQQGEDDTATIGSVGAAAPLRLASLMPDVATFQTQLTGVMAQLRSDLGCGFPLLMGRMADSYLTGFFTDPAEEANAETAKAGVTAAIKAVAAAEPCGNGHFVDSTGLLTNSQEASAPAGAKYMDYTHFSAAALVGNGANTDSLSFRYFRAWYGSAVR